MKKLLKRKGFTLVELIIAMCVSTLLIAAAMAMFGPVQSIINSLHSDVNTNNVTDTISGYIYTRMSKCSTYNVGLYDATKISVDASDEAGVAKRVSAMIADIENPAIEQTYCIMIRQNTDDICELYDLGKINSVSDYLTKAADYEKYELLDGEYYNGLNFKFSFSTTPQDAESTDKKWCRIGVIPFDENGEAVVSERAQMFKLLNMSLTNVTPSSDPDLVDYTYPDDDVIVILYRIKDYSKM